MRVDAVRGDVPFERWVRRALEQALDSQGPLGKVATAAEAEEHGNMSAPARASAAAGRPRSVEEIAAAPIPRIAPRHWAR